jgi:hypothetical protein
LGSFTRPDEPGDRAWVACLAEMVGDFVEFRCSDLTFQCFTNFAVNDPPSWREDAMI